MKPVVKTVDPHNKSTEVIIDYNDTDFRLFWEGKVEEILDRQECRIIRKIHFPSKGWFLDLGCGHGRLIPSYYHPDRMIICVDYAINHLQIASGNHPQKNITYIAADANHLPFKDNTFEAGVSIRLFHHISSPEKFMTETTRVFSKGASLLLSYMNKRSLLRILRFGLQCFKNGHTQIADVLYADHPKFLKELSAKNDWNIENNSGAGFLYQITRMSKLIKRMIIIAKIIHKPIEWFDRAISHILGKCNLALMQYIHLVKKGVNPQRNEIQTLQDILQCPKCKQAKLKISDNSISCSGCKTHYPISGRIIDFRIQ